MAVGVNTLRTMMPKISEKGELTTKYTKHSLRATSASRMFASNVPEKVIQEKTGHGSLAGLRAYERTTTRQEQVVAKILESSRPTFSEECSKENSDPQVDEQIPTLPSSSSTPTSTSSIPTSTVPSNLFSGQLQNCVFNFYAK